MPNKKPIRKQVRISLTPETHRLYKIFAAQNDMKLGELVEDVLKKYIKNKLR